VEAVSLILIFGGLAVEFGAGIKATLIARQKISNLTTEAKASLDKAASAEKDASDSKVLAARIGTTNGWLVASNLVVEGQVEELRKANDEFEKEQMPMTIGEMISFARTLHKFSGVNVIMADKANDNKGVFTAYELKKSLTMAGWKILDELEKNVYTVRTGGIRGIVIGVNEDKNDAAPVTIAAHFLNKTFSDRNLPSTFEVLTNGIPLPTNTMLIAIGDKPNPTDSEFMVASAKQDESKHNWTLYLSEHPSRTQSEQEELEQLEANWLKLVVQTAMVKVETFNDLNKNSIRKTTLTGDSMDVFMSNNVPIGIFLKPNLFLNLTNGVMSGGVIIKTNLPASFNGFPN
jgi:hypothetical protein